MSHQARNLPPISTLAHSAITTAPGSNASTNTNTPTVTSNNTSNKSDTSRSLEAENSHSVSQEDGRNGTASVSPHQSQQLLHHSHSENSTFNETNEKIPVHPNAKTTTSTNTANGSTTSKTNIASPVCRNCKTQTTPLWRRDESGQVLCNACGLFLKLHGRPRPISLKTDVIKSRNRIRHTPGSLKHASSNPNTPELKAKESGSAGNNGGTAGKQKFSPKQYQPGSKSNKNSPALAAHGSEQQHSPSLVPLLPRSEHNWSNSPSQQQHHFQTPTQPQQHQQHNATNPHHHHTPYIKQHFAQPLHYPSSAPVQFAPNLAKITSPLLLATTSATPKFNPSQSSERGSLNNKQKDKELAAVALETLSNNGNHNDFEDKRITMMKLESGSNSNSRVPFSPSSALDSGNSPLISAQQQQQQHQSTKLPALVAAASGQVSQHTNRPGSASPSFGPQFSLSASQQQQQQQQQQQHHSIESLPSLKPLLHDAPHGLPSIQHPHASLLNPITHYGSQISNSSHNSPAQQQDLKQNLPPIQQHLSQDEAVYQTGTASMATPTSNTTPAAAVVAHPQSTATSATSDDNVNVLKTRISELELVNDLYRTRIMELEAMENAAKQRENLLKKKLEELNISPWGKMMIGSSGAGGSHSNNGTTTPTPNATPTSLIPQDSKDQDVSGPERKKAKVEEN